MSFFEVISEEEFNAAEAEAEDTARSYPTPKQEGPLRYWDATLRCASKGCSSPTHWKLQGVPYCYIHAMRKMNIMLVSFGVHN